MLRVPGEIRFVQRRVADPIFTPANGPAAGRIGRHKYRPHPRCDLQQHAQLRPDVPPQCGVGFFENEFRRSRLDSARQFPQPGRGRLRFQPSRICIQTDHLRLGARLQLRLHLRRQSVRKCNPGQLRSPRKVIG